MNHEEEYEKMLRSAHEAEGESLYNGIRTLVNNRNVPWDNLTDDERQQVLDIEIESTQAWWAFVSAYVDCRKGGTE